MNEYDDAPQSMPDEPSLAPGKFESGTYRQSRRGIRDAVVRLRLLLAFALFGAAIAWATHLMLAQFVSEWSYFSGFYRRSFLGLSISLWIIAVGAVALTTLAAASVWVGMRLRNQAQRDEAAPSVSSGSAEFVAAVGVVSGIVFVLTILAQSLPLLFFPDGT
jgi:formate hydrogenlyase subunit 3/multisubunit Na+/H+ antiporter MnhD subunit